MRRILCLLLSFLMIFAGTLCVTANETPEKIFDLGIADNSGAIAVSDKTGGTLKDIAFDGAELKYHDNGTTKTPYIQFAKYDGTNAKEEYMYITPGQNANLFGQEKVSFATWMLIPENYDQLDGYADQFFGVVQSNTLKWGQEIATDGGKIYLRATGEGTTFDDVDITAYAGKWMQILVTREFNATAQTVDYKTYVNGELKLSKQATGVTAVDVTKNAMVIGNSYWAQPERRYYGGMATATLYKGVFDDALAKSLYDTEKGAYAEKATTPDTPDQPDTPVAPTTPDKVFDLGLNDDGTIYNVIGNKSITDQQFLNATYPAEFKEYDNGTTKTPYIQYPAHHGVDKNGNSAHMYITKGQDSTLFGNTKASFVTWLYLPQTVVLDSDKYNKMGYFFSIIPSNLNTNGWKAGLGNDGTNAYIQTQDGKGANCGKIIVDDYLGKWVQVALTREYDETASTIEYKTYINGALKQTYTETEVTEFEKGANIFSVGGHYYNPGWGYYYGGMATATLYKGVFDDALAKSLYDAEKGTYAEKATTPDQPDVPDSPKEIFIEATKENVTSTTGTFENNTNASLFNDNVALLSRLNATTDLSSISATFSDIPAGTYEFYFYYYKGSLNGRFADLTATLGGQSVDMKIVSGINEGNAGQFVKIGDTFTFDKENDSIVFKIHEGFSVNQYSQAGNVDFFVIDAFKLVPVGTTPDTPDQPDIPDQPDVPDTPDPIPETKKIFDLGFTKGANDVATLVDTTGNTDPNGWASNNIKVKTYKNANGSFDYLKFETYGDLSNQFIGIGSGENVNEIKNKNATSYETWLYVPEEVTTNVQYPSQNFPMYFFGIVGNNNSPASWVGTMGNDGNIVYMQMKAEGVTKFDKIDITDKQGKWVHLAFTRLYDTSTKKITYKTYLDGDLVETKESAEIDGVDKKSSVVFVGSPYWGQDGYRFYGGIAKSTFYEGILTDAEVEANYKAGKDKYAQASDLILDVDLSNYDGTAGSLVDASGNITKFNDNSTGAMGVDETGIEKFNYAMTGNKYLAPVLLEVGSGENQIKTTNDLTIQMWLNIPKDQNQNPHYLTWHNTDDAGMTKQNMVIESVPNHPYLYFGASPDGKKQKNAQVRGFELGSWFQLTITRSYNVDEESATYTAYINGSAQQTFTVEDVDIKDKSFIGLGGLITEAGNRRNITKFASFKIFKKALSDQQVSDTYVAEREKYYQVSFKPKEELKLDQTTVAVEMVSGEAKNDIVITNTQTGEEVEFTYSENAGNMELSFPQYFVYGEQFKIESKQNGYNYINVTKGSIELTADLTNGSDMAIDSVKGYSDVKVPLTITNTSDSKKTVKYTVLVKNQKGATIKAVSGTTDVDKTATPTVSLTGLINATEILVYAWEIDDSINLLPLAGTPIVK